MGSDFLLGACSSQTQNQGYSIKQGMPAQSLSGFYDGNKVCVFRSGMNYHDVVAARDTCKSGKQCGNATVSSDFSYCLKD